MFFCHRAIEKFRIPWTGLFFTTFKSVLRLFKNSFRAFALQEISAIKSNLEKIADKVEEHLLATEEIQTYSYRFNVKLLGASTRGTALHTTTLCVKIFNKMGAEVSN